MREGEHHDGGARKLIGNSERKSIEHGHTPIPAITPLRCGVGEVEDHRERRINLVFQLVSETGLPDS
jgi:hypothetical protein